MENQNRPGSRPTAAKWKINSNGYGWKILAAAGLFVIVLPTGLYFCTWLLHLMGVNNTALLFAIKISLAAGAVIVALFILLLMVEFIQDRILDRDYLKNKKRKLPLADGRYECQYCGARNIGASDEQCPICGKRFDSSPEGNF